MRTPLNGVIAMADVLRETNLNESQREIVETMTTSAQLLLVQIEDVLDMAKIEAGRVLIERRPFDMGQLLSSTVKVVVPQARYKDLDVTTDVASQAAGWFLGDPHHIRQVLLNLLSNAVKFTERGAITLRARAFPLAGHDAPTRIRIEVQDTGIGIAPAKQAAIFEPFTQADDSITRVYGGTGLGTTIARHLVQLMGGQIGLQSTVGGGSLFWFEISLPQGEPAGVDLAGDAASTVKVTSSMFAPANSAKVRKLRGARILVAEDNSTNQRVAQLILESGGHKVTIVPNGEAALDALDRGGYDLALFDLSMPVVSGLEALKLYRFTNQSPKPVLILSANVTTEAIAECQRAGAAEFIPKPLRASYLLDAIDRHVDGQASQSVGSAPPKADERTPLAVVDTPILDPDVLEDLARLSTDPTFVDRLLRGFLADTSRLVKELSCALTQRSYEATKDGAHALRGGALSVGASQLTQIATRIEKSSHDTLRLRSAQLIEDLVQSADRATSEVEKFLEQRRRNDDSGQLNG
jgi:two-component system sensor histidine kinase RpfC